MATRVVDTNVISYQWKQHTLAANYDRYLQGHDLCISFMTLAELREWAIKSKWKKNRLDRFAEFIGRLDIVDSTIELCQRWAEIRYERRSQPIGVADAWFAATALLLDCELVTHNSHDFRSIRGLRIITEPEL